MQSALVTGGNRGIGLEHVRQLLSKGWQVFAGARRPESSPQLDPLKQEHPDTLHVVRLDVTREEDIADAREYVEEAAGKLDLLINNAGIFAKGEEGLANTRVDRMMEVYHVNVVGPVTMAKHFAELLSKADHAKVVNTTSGAGLLREEELRPGRQYSYAATKSALNIVIRRMAADLKERGVVAVGIGPGFVKTDMTAHSDREPPLTPLDSVTGQLALIERLTLDDAGKFFGHDGKICDWMR